VDPQEAQMALAADHQFRLRVSVIAERITSIERERA
jgi:hypothetical protein